MEYTRTLQHVRCRVLCHFRVHICSCEEAEAECVQLGYDYGVVVYSVYVPPNARAGKEVTANSPTGGCIHLFFEGYFAYNFRRMGGMQDLFGQLWKEYSLSDSRYLTQDAFVLCMETITAVRLCFPSILSVQC